MTILTLRQRVARPGKARHATAHTQLPICIKVHAAIKALLYSNYTLRMPGALCVSAPQAGALLAIGIVNACVQNENDPAFALISEYVSHSDINIRTGKEVARYLASERDHVAVYRTGSPAHLLGPKKQWHKAVSLRPARMRRLRALARV